jgi:hypothetical protein
MLEKSGYQAYQVLTMDVLTLYSSLLYGYFIADDRID